MSMLSCNQLAEVQRHEPGPDVPGTTLLGVPREEWTASVVTELCRNHQRLLRC